jgi:RNA ligase
MTHPTIHHLNDVLPSIADRSEFVHAQREGYSVIDYNFALADSFDDPMRLECRGIKFAPDGTLLARPLHKFFNINERDATQAHVLDFNQPHTITEKMDGSMIHPAIVDGALVFMTRMGRTDHAIKAERHITEDVDSVCRSLIGSQWTPIFEWTAPDNRIVVRYPDSRLTLLAIRYMPTGQYMPYGELAEYAQDMGIQLVPQYDPEHTTGQSFVDFARAVTGKEGFVIRFADGTWVKAKGDDYVLKHKAKESILQERNVLALVLRGELDDVLPLLEAEDRAAVETYRTDVEAGIRLNAAFIANHVAAGETLDQKTFAIAHMLSVDPRRKPLCFQVRAGTPATEAVKGALLKAVGSQTNVDATRHLHGASFAL